jgi:cyclophilin family peptidyl-prolyl cis-trans isomerase
MAAINPGDVIKDHQNVLLPILGIVLLVLGLGYYLGRGENLFGEGDLLFSDDRDVYEEYPDMTINPELDYRAEIVTSKGTIEIDLFETDAPLAVNSFRFLAERGFYNDLTFHRVIDGFMIQGGDPDGDGSGGPGYTFADELNNGHAYEAGILAMANSGSDTNGSQFFITVSSFTRDLLTSEHTVFGKVTLGLEIVDEISKVETDGSDKPLEDIIIERVYVDAYTRD